MYQILTYLLIFFFGISEQFGYFHYNFFSFQKGRIIFFYFLQTSFSFGMNEYVENGDKHFLNFPSYGQ
jgi:hypothetical protein